MGLLYISLSVLCSLCIAHLLKLARKAELSIVPVLVINYITAAAISFFQSDAQFLLYETSFVTYVFAIGTGCLFIINFFLYSYSLNKNGVGVSIAAMRLSLVLPVIVSLFFYNEYLEATNYVGILFVFIALLLLIPFSKSKHGISFSASLIFLFVLNGLVDVLLKIYDRELASSITKDLFLFLIFISAFIFGSLYLLAKKEFSFDRKSIFYGFLIGIVNLYSSFFLLLALENLSGALVFSATNMLNVFLGTLLGVFYWKDHLKRNQIWGLGLAILAIILLIM
jgi:drug/metabolite transporter (DMT)-like permease